MRRLWHRIVGHRWRNHCQLCALVRFHDEHEYVIACDCGEEYTP